MLDQELRQGVEDLGTRPPNVVWCNGRVVILLPPLPKKGVFSIISDELVFITDSVEVIKAITRREFPLAEMAKFLQPNARDEVIFHRATLDKDGTVVEVEENALRCVRRADGAWELRR